jgi:flagellar basal body-associated protein FliL
MMRYLIPLLIIAVFACLLIGWAIAWYFSKDESKPVVREDADDADS